MIEEIEIRLWDLIVGYAAYRDSRLAYFEYDPKFPELYDLAPLMMPRSQSQIWSFDLNEATFHGLPGLLADSLPDKYGNQMIDIWFAKEGIPLGQVSALDRLCYLGTRAMGALEFFPERFDKSSLKDEIDIADLVNLSGKILQERLDISASIEDLPTILRMGSSAGGARAKAVIALNPQTSEMRSGQIPRKGFEYWIIKLDGITNQSVGDPLGYTNIEYAYYLMAKDCGIDMRPSKLMQENGRSHFLTKRFDRDERGEKLHMQTVCALAHLDYNKPRTVSYEILFRIMNQLALPMSDKEQLFKRMVFNVIGRNHDDHTKNFSFLMNKNAEWRLAPAYDLIFSYNPDHYWLKEHNLLVNGKSTDINRDDLMTLARKFHIKKTEQFIDEIIQVFTKFKSYAKQAGVSKEQVKFIYSNLEFLS
jgi:serine/threonine-protein kinase HipA